MIILCLIGKSASGKTFVRDKLVKEHSYKSLVTFTSRPPRKGEKQDITYHFSGCYKVKIEHEIEYHKNIASKELTRCQIPYFMQDVEVKELQIDSNRYMEFKINMYPIELSVLCDSFEIY